MKVQPIPMNPSVIKVTYMDDSGNSIGEYIYAVSMDSDNPGFTLISQSK